MDGPLRILFLAPHPFFQERGTPIAVDLALRALSGLGHEILLLTYPEGEDRPIPGVRIERVRPAIPVRGIRPGFSWKKLVCDAALAPAAARAARAWKPHLTHAVEEGVFIARGLRRRFGIPYLYDMDSALSHQLIESRPWLAPAQPLFRAVEARAIRGALAVLPVCPALADLAAARGARTVRVLTDVSLLDPARPPADAPGLEPGGGPDGFAFLYLGNLERYQGVDLMLDAFALAAARDPRLRLFVVGGPPAAAKRYADRAARLGLGDRIRFPGARPLRDMAALFRDADALVSPRIRGVNTPMKIYSYLDSGKPVLATDLPTHAQVIGPDVAELAAPEPRAFAEGMLRLAGDPERGRRLASAARDQVRRRHSRAAYAETLSSLYEEIRTRLRGPEAGT